MRAFFLGLIFAAGCNQILGVGDPTLAGDGGNQPDGAPSPDAGPSGPHHQYVANTITVPVNSTQARQCGVDLDGDGNIDNQLGNAFAALAGQNIDVQNATTFGVNNGLILQLFDIQAQSLTSAPARVRPFFGVDSDMPPDPTNNFSGNETFTIRNDSPPDAVADGPITNDQLHAGPGHFSIEVGVSNTAVLPLIDARIAAAFSTGAIDTGIMAGALTTQTVDDTLIPAMQVGFEQVVMRDCSQLSAPPSCGCTQGSSGQSLISILDSNNDCVISVSEVQNNSLIQSLLQPDLDLFDSSGNPGQDGNNDSLSFGECFTAVGAQFTLP